MSLNHFEYILFYSYILFTISYFPGVNDGASTSKDENWEPIEDNLNYHVLKLPRESINVVDNGRLFEDFLDNGLRNVIVVGIDLEWKPSFGNKI